MFYREEKKTKPINPHILKDKELVASKDLLLSEKKRQALLQQIKDSLAYQASYYQKFAQPLIEKVAVYYQYLPETSTYFGHRGGLLDRALHRTEAAVNLMRQLMRRDESNVPSEEQKVWLYAVFSAGLLQNIGKLYTEYKITIYDDLGTLVRPWKPVSEEMQTVGTYYSHTFIREDSDSEKSKYYITLMLAKQLMPKEGLALLEAHPDIFKAWLALLAEDRDGAGPLHAVLDRANALTLQQYLQDYRDQHAHLLDQTPGRMGTFLDNTPENTLEKEQALGAEFLLWIRDALASGKLVLNQPPLQASITVQDISLSPEVYDIFLQEHLKVKNKIFLQRALNTWKHHTTIDSNDAQHDKLSRANLHLDKAILPEKVKVYNSQTQRITTVRALDLVHDMEAYSRQYERTPVILPELNTDGQWTSSTEAQSPQIRPGIKPSA